MTQINDTIIRGGKMTLTQKAKLIFVAIAAGTMIYFAVLAIQFGNKLSANCEKSYADAIRTMQGK